LLSERFASYGWRDGSACAIEESDAEIGFEFTQTMADCGCCDAEFVSGLFDALASHDCDEYVEIGEP
jgi:hypothetical protein